MAKTAKSTTNSVEQISASVKVAAKGTKKGSEKGPKKVKLQPAAQLRSSGKVGPGLPSELYDDQLEEGPGPMYYNG